MVIDQTITDQYAAYNGDCIEVMRGMPDAKMDFAIFSPPFADLYCYSDSPQDLGNCRTYEAFFEHFGFVVEQLARILKSGRNCAVHCMDLPAMKERDGFIGVKDFPGDIIRLFQKHGFIFHSRHIIWKDPLIEATRTKALGLMHKQLQKDSIMARAGLPDQLLCFRNAGENEIPISHPDGLTTYCGSDDPTRGITGIKRSHNIWRAYASPVWMDIRQTHTLNFKAARDENDEKHICPLQLDTIERAVVLWSNPGEVVFTPFMGVGSEVFGAVMNGRKGVGVELKSSYYQQAISNLRQIESDSQESLFADTTK